MIKHQSYKWKEEQTQVKVNKQNNNWDLCSEGTNSHNNQFSVQKQTKEYKKGDSRVIELLHK